MSDLLIHHGEWVVVCDGAKALVLENTGDAKFPNLKMREVFEQKDLATHELGSDRPGRTHSSVGAWPQRRGADRLARSGRTGLSHPSRQAARCRGRRRQGEVADHGGAAARARHDPRRPTRHALRAAVRSEVDKDFVKQPVHEIEKHLTA